MIRGFVLLLILVTFGCRGDDEDGPENELREAEENRTVESKSNEANKMEGGDFRSADAGQLFDGADQASVIDGSMISVDWDSSGESDSCCEDPCSEIEAVSIAWDEITDLQVSAEEVFGPIVGTCTAPLTWDGTDIWSMRGIVLDPQQGQSDVTVTVEADERSTRYLRPSGEDAELNGCTGSLEVDATVSVQTEDGIFDDSGDTTIVYSPGENIFIIRFQREITELGGTFSVELPEDYARGELRYWLDGAGPSCSGEIVLSVSKYIKTSGGTTIGGGGFDTLGAWTATNCPMGTTPLEIEADDIEALLDDVSFPGIWDDGQISELNVSLEAQGQTVCAEIGDFLNAEASGHVTYGTSDGRIKEHTTEAMLFVNYYKNRQIRGLECHVSDEMKCDESDDEIDYTLKDCSALDFVTIQFGIHRSEDETYFSDEGIEIYENYRGGAAWPGSGDEVRYFNLEQ